MENGPIEIVDKIPATKWWIFPWQKAIEIVDFPIKNGGSFHGKMIKMSTFTRPGTAYQVPQNGPVRHRHGIEAIDRGTRPRTRWSRRPTSRGPSPWAPSLRSATPGLKGERILRRICTEFCGGSGAETHGKLWKNHGKTMEKPMEKNRW